MKENEMKDGFENLGEVQAATICHQLVNDPWCMQNFQGNRQTTQRSTIVNYSPLMELACRLFASVLVNVSVVITRKCLELIVSSSCASCGVCFCLDLRCCNDHRFVGRCHSCEDAQTDLSAALHC